MTPADAIPRCWCGNTSLSPFSDEYLRCERCDTLVTRVTAPSDVSSVRDEQTDLYGLNYFVEHAHELGHPDLFERTRSDLSERCVFWLKTLLRHRPPPARTLELGCGNGCFVAMLAASGYEATGLDLSPSLTDHVRRTFEVPVLTGRLEDQHLPPASIDVLVMMDVLEHLPDPLATLAAASRVLAEDGLLLVQTPHFDPALSFRELVDGQHAFLQQLKAREHLFLLSERSAGAMLERAGFGHLAFEPAIFSQYDMFFIASRVPIPSCPAWRESLRRSPSGRIVEALVDAWDSARSHRPQVTDHAILADELVSAGPVLSPDAGSGEGVVARTLRALRDGAARLREAHERLGAQEQRLGAQEQRLGAQEQRLGAQEQELQRLKLVESDHRALVRRLGPLKFLARRPNRDRNNAP